MQVSFQVACPLVEKKCYPTDPKAFFYDFLAVFDIIDSQRRSDAQCHFVTNFGREEVCLSHRSQYLAPLGRSLLGFLGAGAIGFCVDGGILTALTSLAGWSPVASRMLSFPVALTCTWLLNRRWAFAGRGLGSNALEYLAYAGIQVAGAGINLGVFISCLRRWPELASIPLVPFAVGAGFALIFNYGSLRWLLYRRRID
jgi:putative flippase GtrA